MKKLLRIIIVVLLLCIGYLINRPEAPISQKVFTTFGITIPPQSTGYTTGTAWIPNAASRYCEKKGGTIQVLNGPDGRYAMCHLSNGKTCEVRSYYRGECGLTNPGGNGNDTGSVNDTGTTIDPCDIKDPICALVPVNCIDGTAPCPPVEKTFMNMCLMNLVKSAKFLHKGVCKDPTSPNITTK